MKLLEIKNNLVKLSYEEEENPILGRFIVLIGDPISYVAQLVNLKVDSANNFAIAKLIFTFTPDGVVDNYDGSVPKISAEVLPLDTAELLDLLPVETPVRIGQMAQQSYRVNLDVSAFEKNLTVFAQRSIDKSTFMSNCVRQFFQMKEKSVIIDNENFFEDYPKIVFTKDFKLPLNSEMIDYLFEHELTEVDAATKAVIQDIFYAVQQYIKTLDYEFLPIDNFVDVVANQYKETQMPELALLKNKLLKYRDSNIFANTKDEVLAFDKKLSQKNCSIVDIKDIQESLQKEVIAFVHKALEKLEKYVYFFVPLTDDNSDKKLLKQMVNHNHVFTTLLASHSYKYAKELKAIAENIILFAPPSQQHDFAAYNTLLCKLNMGEAVVYGKLTQGIPFVAEINDLKLDLTRDDVLGDRFQFVPVEENTKLVDADGVSLDSVLEEKEAERKAQEQAEAIANGEIDLEQEEAAPIEEFVEPEPVQNLVSEEIIEASPVLENIVEDIPGNNTENFAEITELPTVEEVLPVSQPQIVEPVANIFEEAPIVEEIPISDYPEEETLIQEEIPPVIEEAEFAQETLTEDDLNFIEEAQTVQPEELVEEPIVEDYSDADSYVESPYVEEQPPVVPVYPVEDEQNNTTKEGGSVEFAQGDSVSHPRYGRGVVEKIIKYGNKTLCSIAFENVGRRLLDPSISEFVKL